MLIIRLSRVGKKKHAFYKVIISEKARDTKGTFLELLGHYNPHTNKAELKAERIAYWLSKGAQTSGVVHNILVDQKLVTGEKIKVANIKKKEATAPVAAPAEKKPEAKKPAEVKAEEPKTEAPAAETPKAEEKKP